ncbi:hypothetical protein L917_01410 [Phytophthora nicotianae]|uniref:RxLR effector protein n=2 Tax=Phytophthora nicotianae TaxID=4792 RepID=W2LZP7_PHYNI|nr:hypothetical protein L917_01410 [Phytophthora nicotianae]
MRLALWAAIVVLVTLSACSRAASVNLESTTSGAKLSSNVLENDVGEKTNLRSTTNMMSTEEDNTNDEERAIPAWRLRVTNVAMATMGHVGGPIKKIIAKRLHGTFIRFYRDGETPATISARFGSESDVTFVYRVWYDRVKQLIAKGAVL